MPAMIRRIARTRRDFAGISLARDTLSIRMGMMIVPRRYRFRFGPRKKMNTWNAYAPCWASKRTARPAEAMEAPELAAEPAAPQRHRQRAALWTPAKASLRLWSPQILAALFGCRVSSELWSCLTGVIWRSIRTGTGGWAQARQVRHRSLEP